MYICSVGVPPRRNTFDGRTNLTAVLTRLLTVTFAFPSRAKITASPAFPRSRRCPLPTIALSALSITIRNLPTAMAFVRGHATSSPRVTMSPRALLGGSFVVTLPNVDCHEQLASGTRSRGYLATPVVYSTSSRAIGTP